MADPIRNALLTANGMQPSRFYSKLEDTAKALPMEKMQSAQAAAAFKAVPQDELKWTKMNELLASNPNVTKSQLLQHIGQHGVKTEEVHKHKGESKEELLKQRRIWEDNLRFPEFDPAVVRQHLSELDRKIENSADSSGPTKFHQYALPGGKNYGETLIKQPATTKALEQWKVVRPDGYVIGTYADENSARAAAERSGQIGGGAEVRKAPTLNLESGFKSSHWDEPNVLAHIRHQEFTGFPQSAPDKAHKVFNLDEAQSDWGQKGRDEGFKPSKEELAAKENKLEAMEKNWRELEEQYLAMPRNSQEQAKKFEEYKKSYKEHSAAKDEYLKGRNGISPAPYVTTTKGWTELALKKALDHAIKSGAHYFTWTPGKTQADRYNLAKQVKSIKYQPDMKRLMIYPHKGETQVEFGVEPDHLPNHLGKEVAKKLLESEKDHLDNHFLSDENLHIGGEGMKNYYDSILPNHLSEIVRKAIGKKPEFENVKLVGRPDEPHDEDPVHHHKGFKITDELRNARFPTFARGGKALQAAMNLNKKNARIGLLTAGMK